MENQDNVEHLEKQASELIQAKDYIKAEVVADRLFELNHYAQAINIYAGIIQANPEYDYKIDGLGNNQEQVGYYQFKKYAWYKEKKANKQLKGSPYDALSLCYTALKVYEDGAKWYEKMIKAYPLNYQLYFGHANILYNSAIYEEAIKQYSKVIELRPQFLKPYIDIALIYQYKRIEKRKSISWANSALQMDKNNQYAQFILARNELDVDKKIKRLIEVWQIQPKNTRVCNEVGICYGGTKKMYREAIKWYQKCTEFNPNYSSAYNNIGVNYELLKQFDSARQWYFKAIESDNQYKTAHKNLTDIFDELGTTDDQIVDISLNYKIRQDYFFYYLGLSYYDKSKVQKSIQWIERAISINDQDHKFYNSLAISYDEDKKIEQAIQIYKRCIELNPKYYSAYYNIAIAYKNQGKEDLAIQWYKKSVEINPRYSYAYNNLGNIYKNKQDYLEAIEFYKKAVEFNSTYTLAYVNLAVCYLKEEQYLNASYVLSRAQQLYNTDNNNLSEANKTFLKPHLQQFEQEGFKWKKFAERSAYLSLQFKKVINSFYQTYTYKESEQNLKIQESTSKEIIKISQLLSQGKLQLKFIQIFESIKRLSLENPIYLKMLPQIIVHYFWAKFSVNKDYLDVQLELHEMYLQKVQHDLFRLQLHEQLNQSKDLISKVVQRYNQDAKKDSKVNLFQETAYFVKYEDLYHLIMRVDSIAKAQVQSFLELTETISTKFQSKSQQVNYRIPTKKEDHFRSVVLIAEEIFTNELGDCKMNEIQSKLNKIMKNQPNLQLSNIIQATLKYWMEVIEQLLEEKRKNNIEVQCFISNLISQTIEFKHVKDLLAAIDFTFEKCKQFQFEFLELRNQLFEKASRSIIISLRRKQSVFSIKFSLQSKINKEGNLLSELYQKSHFGFIFGCLLSLSQNKSFSFISSCYQIMRNKSFSALLQDKSSSESIRSIYAQFSKKY